jgi:Protein of unknown function (DUF4079)
MTLSFTDFLGLIHPILAVVVVFPLLGMVVNRAWLARSRRLSSVAKENSAIPPQVGREHRDLGRWLTGAVVGLTLIGLAYPIFEAILEAKKWVQSPLQVAFIVAIFGLTIGSLILLYRAQPKHWRAIFATLTGMGLVILGLQEGVYRRTNEWYVSHYYYGITAACLMIFALAILPDIYQDKTLTWRRVHIILNSVALVLFIGQGFTGTRDLLEIPLGWQKTYIYQCNFELKTCPTSMPKTP